MRIPPTPFPSFGMPYKPLSRSGMQAQYAGSYIEELNFGDKLTFGAKHDHVECPVAFDRQPILSSKETDKAIFNPGVVLDPKGGYHMIARLQEPLPESIKSKAWSKRSRLVYIHLK